MAVIKRKKARLTCQCGVPYTLNAVADLPTRCINERCHAALIMSANELKEYQRSLRALVEALEHGRDYRQAMETAKNVSSRVKSPYTLDVVEIPTPVTGFWQD
jgi:hypothetical protein